MPYKDPEHKRQWEREHRKQRNARRRMQAARSGHESVATPTLSDALRSLRARQKQAPDPASDRKPQGTWKTILGWAVGIGVVLLAAFAAVDVSPYNDLGPAPGADSTGM